MVHAVVSPIRRLLLVCKLCVPLLIASAVMALPVRAAPVGSSPPIWFYPSTWYPYLLENGVPRPGTGPGRRIGYDLQGDFNAMFKPGAPWTPSQIGLLVLNNVDIQANPEAAAIAAWSNAHPQIKIGIVVGSPLTVGPGSGCVSSGMRGFPPKGTPLTATSEAVEYHDNYSTPGWNYSRDYVNAIEQWKKLGGRLDVVLLDAPLTGGVFKCSFSVPQTVHFLAPTAQQILNLYPNVQFSIDQGPSWGPNQDWIDNELQFVKEFPNQIINPLTHAGVPVLYANFDLRLDGPDLRTPSTPLYTSNGVAGTINKATLALNAAGVRVAVNINTLPNPGESQEQVIARLHALLRQVMASGLPFDHISIQPFSLYHRPTWVIKNLPDTSPSALTWLLEPKY